jgi:hypothetical protein
MSAKDVQGFFEKVAESKPLQAKLKKLAKDQEDESAAATVEVASAAGFKFTASELLKARKAKASKMPKPQMPEVAGQYYCPYGLGTGPGNYW